MRHKQHHRKDLHFSPTSQGEERGGEGKREEEKRKERRRRKKGGGEDKRGEEKSEEDKRKERKKTQGEDHCFPLLLGKAGGVFAQDPRRESAMSQAPNLANVIPCCFSAVKIFPKCRTGT